MIQWRQLMTSLIYLSSEGWSKKPSGAPFFLFCLPSSCLSVLFYSSYVYINILAHHSLLVEASVFVSNHQATFICLVLLSFALCISERLM